MAKKSRSKTTKPKNYSSIITMISIAVLIVIVSALYFSASNNKEILGSQITGPTGCSDSDGGKKFYQTGTVTSGSKTYPDKCMSRSGGINPTYTWVSSCGGSNCILRETFCASSTTSAYTDKICACSYGECV